MPYPAKAIANEFIYKSEGKVSPMKLQKLVYFAHGWFLAYTGEPLINERIEAWQFGPVIPSLYHEFKSSGSGVVMNPASQLVVDGLKFTFIVPRIEGDDENAARARDVIQQVWDAYGRYSATRLSNATHMAGTPWSETYREGEKSLVINNDLIRDYFRSLQ